MEEIVQEKDQFKGKDMIEQDIRDEKVEDINMKKFKEDKNSKEEDLIQTLLQEGLLQECMKTEDLPEIMIIQFKITEDIKGLKTKEINDIKMIK